MSARPAPGDGAIHLLAHGALRVEIETATKRHEAHFGPRFDRTAAVRSVRVGEREFLGPWGLCDEFGLQGDGVLGYGESGVAGPAFVKIGVGRLQRDTEGGYDFSHRYPVLARCGAQVKAAARQLSVHQDSGPGQPERYVYEKRYTLHPDNMLTVCYRLGNAGDVAWSFEHYNHHWFRLQPPGVGPAYRLKTGFRLPPMTSGFLQHADSLRPAAPLHAAEALYYASDLPGLDPADNTFAWEVDGETMVRFAGDFPPARFALYASADGFCPEVFMRCSLAPGATACWSATYRFASQ